VEGWNVGLPSASTCCRFSVVSKPTRFPSRVTSTVAAVTLKSPYGWTYTFTHLGVSQYNALNRQVTAATVEVTRDGKRVGLLTTEKRQHVDAEGNPTFQPSTEVGIRSDLREDLYVVLAGVVNGTEQAVYRFTINPLVWWVWYGGMIVALGGLIVMWPGGGSITVRRAQAGYAVRLVTEKAVE
jgi:cytochrome c-type biogenesis protein CcmF